MSNRAIHHNDPDLRKFFAFARDAELSILKSGRSAPTRDELDTFASEYWLAVDRLRSRLDIMSIDQPTTDPVVQEFLDLTLRCEAAWRSRIKPRGDAGDYRLMELFYELENTDEAKPLGTEPRAPGQRLVEAAFARTHGIRLIKKRAKLLEAFLAGQIAKSERPLNILDFGGGGARYFRRALAQVNNTRVRYTIFDQDASLPEFWRRDVPKSVSSKVRVISAPVKALLEGEHPGVSSQKFDIVLSSGLFDYLEQDVAQALASRLFALLRPEGKLVIANILDSEPARAAFFRDTLMDWKIVTRSDAQMQALVPQVNAEKYKRFSDVDLGIVTFTKH